MMTSAGQATEVAVEFLKRYYAFVVPVKAQREDGQWLVQADVGAIAVRLATVRLDAQSGEILSFDAEAPHKAPGVQSVIRP